MRVVLRLPDVGEGLAEAEIVEYLVAVGDRVQADQNVVRIETDKAVVELPAPEGGTIVEIPHKPGDTVRVGESLIVIETGAVVMAGPPKGPEEVPAETDTHASTSQPVLPKEVFQPALRIVQTERETKTKRALATPHTRRLARELGLDIDTITGTGPHGRVTDQDLRPDASRSAPTPSPLQAASQAPSAGAAQVAEEEGMAFEKYGPVRRVPLRGVRKRIAQVMVKSVSIIPHVTHVDEADVTELFVLLERERAAASQRGIKLTALSFIMKAVVAALRAYPAVNASLDDERGELVYRDYYHIGVATDTESGLMVPVLRDADRRSIMEIAAELQTLSQKARDRTISSEEMRGGTFTITNIGGIAGTGATPIILHPQVAILATMRGAAKPVVRKNQVIIRTIMPLWLSFDHRVLDGAVAARFVKRVIELIEDPMKLLLEAI